MLNQSALQVACADQEIWTPVEGETLTCRRKMRNRDDLFAVAALRKGEVVRHVPWSLLWMFLVLGVSWVNGLSYHWEEAALE